MIEGLDAVLKAALDDMRLQQLARLDKMEATLVNEFRQSTLRMESRHLPAEPARHDSGEDEHNIQTASNRHGNRILREGDGDIAHQP